MLAIVLLPTIRKGRDEVFAPPVRLPPDRNRTHPNAFATCSEMKAVAKQTPAQKETVERVMHEFKHGELRIRGNGPKVKNPKQAIAIALHEAGATNQESPSTNRENLARTKAKERRGETAKDAAEGRSAKSRATRSRSAKASARNEAGASTRAALYEQAKKQDIPGRSRMNKDELDRALKG